MQIRARLGLTALFALLCGLQGAASPQEPVGFVSAYLWRMDDRRFGGLSGLELSGDGLNLTAISDSANWLTAKITRDAEGKITEIGQGQMGPLKGPKGRPLKWPRMDSEGLAIAADGTAYVSFEAETRVMRYERLDGPGIDLPLHRSFAQLPFNGSLEALAIDDQGRLYTLPETTDSQTHPFPVLRFDGSKWIQIFRLPREGNFLPVGADFGPDGRLYILERRFLGLGGFASRVRALYIPEPGGAPEVQTVLETPPGLHDNLEGLAVWRDGTGAIRLTMVSDDNFSFLLRTEIVEYRLPQ